MNSRLDAITPTPRNELLRRWLLAASCFAVTLFFFSPAWAAFSYWSKVPELEGMIEVRRGASVLQQTQHLGAPIADQLHGAIQWRLLFPVIGRVLHLPAWMLFGLADVGCLVTLAYIATILRRHGLPLVQVAAATVALAASAWFFTSTGWLGYYDSWVVLGLLVLAFGDSRWTIWAACLWAPWIDERFVLGAPIAILCRYLGGSSRTRFDFKRDAAVPAALLAAFVVVRLGVLGGRSGPNATPATYLDALDAMRAPLSRMLFGAWAGLRAGWLFVVAAVVLIARRNAVHALVLGVATLLLVTVGIATAQDFGRSMMFAMPVAVLGAIEIARVASSRVQRLVPVAALVALLLPAHHVISNQVAPIYYLYQALGAYHQPPRSVMPEVMELEAIRAMQNGDFAKAEAGLTMAIRLAPDPSDAAKQRGVLRATQGRWKEAGEDFALMAKYAPQNPDAWFMCAQSALATGDPATARSHLQHATQIAGTDWTSRPDVARFRTRLEQTK